MKGGQEMKTLKKLREAVCGVQGTRTGALVSTVVGALSKPVGYLRTLLKTLNHIVFVKMLEP